MLRYYAWALGEQLLWRAPGGRAVYRRAGRLLGRNRHGTSDSFVNALPVATKVQQLVPGGATIMEVGTGWFHHDAFLLYLVGDYELILFDVEDKAWLPYIRNYLQTLRRHSALLARELGPSEGEIEAKLNELLALTTREAIYDRCGLTLVIDARADTQFWPRKSVDAIVSNCVLVHIRPPLLRAELGVLSSILKDDGLMCHHLGHDDHWAFHDAAMSWPSFNYMRYPEWAWNELFCGFEYHNRLVKPEWIELFGECGLDVADYEVHTLRPRAERPCGASLVSTRASPPTGSTTSPSSTAT